MKRTALVILLLTALSATAQTPLIDQIRNGEIKQIANANETDANGISALTYAVAYLEPDAITTLLKAGANPNLASKEGITPLITAAPNLRKVKLLVEAGADINAKSKAGNTPLARALALPAGLESARYLLSKGAKPDSGALAAAVGHGYDDLVIQFLKADVKVTVAAVSAIAGLHDPKLMDAIADAGRATINNKRPLGGSTSLGGRTAGSLEATRALLDHGADINSQDTRNRTPLMYAASLTHPNAAVIKLLLARGADPTIKDIRNETALDIALANGIRENIEALGGSARASRTPAIPLRPAIADTRESLTRAMALLDKGGAGFSDNNSCVSCHSQSIPQMASAALRRAGLKIPAAQTADVVADLATHERYNWENLTGGGAIQGASYTLAALADEGYPRNPAIDAAVRYLADVQSPDGGWNIEDGLRPPLSGNTSTFTALSIRALSAYPIPGRKRDFEERIARARKLLQASTDDRTESLAYRILGLKWAGAPESVIGRVVAKLSSLQRPDGGWAQMPGLESDAYSTGQVLWALRTGGDMTVMDRHFAAGANFLRRTQLPDGSWYVRSRAMGIQPYVETGFPHGHDQWLSMAATGNAILALAPLVGPAN